MGKVTKSIRPKGRKLKESDVKNFEPVNLEDIGLGKLSPENRNKEALTFSINPKDMDSLNPKKLNSTIEKIKKVFTKDFGDDNSITVLPKKGGLTVRINYAKGGEVMAKPTEQQMSLMLEGGGFNDEGGTVDPVSGNPVPIGNTKEGVRDDVPIMASEREYVVDAGTVNYFGVQKYNDEKKQALAGYKQMEKDGLMGQPTQGAMLDSNEDTPFNIEDLDVTDAEGQPVTMANGGIVPKGFYHGGYHYNPVPVGVDEMGRPIQATSSTRQLNVNQPNRPQPETFKDVFPSQDEEYMVTKYYRHPDGRNIPIIFINGVPIQNIPEGFVEVDPNSPLPPAPPTSPVLPPAEAVKPVEFEGGPDDPEIKSFDTMSPNEIFEFSNLLSKLSPALEKNWPGLSRAKEIATVTTSGQFSRKQQSEDLMKAERDKIETQKAAEELAEKNRLDQIEKDKIAADKIKAAKELIAKAEKEAEEKQKIADAQEFLRQDRLTREKIAADEARKRALAEERALAEKIAADRKAEADAISYTLEQPDGGTSYTAPSTPTGGSAGYSGSYNEPGRGDGPDGPDGNGGGGGGSGGGGGGNSGGSAGGGGGPYNKGGFVPKKPKNKIKTYKKGGLVTPKK